MARSNATTPNALASSLSKALGRTITAKAVRTVARGIVKAYDKVSHPAYQSHAYTPEQVRTITAAFRARGTRTASAGTAKVAARKSAPKAKSAIVAAPDAS